MIDKLNLIEQKYKNLKEQIQNPELMSDYHKLNKLNQELSHLEGTISKYSDYKKTKEEIKELKEMLNDPEIESIAKEELFTKEKHLENIEKKLEILLIPKDENDNKDIIMEIRGAAGGDEANIFAGDLYRMYSKYADNNNWKIEVINEFEGTSGGFSQIEFSIKGVNVYSKLKFESGAHRVQRVPETETQGRIHTSTATVVVMPEADDVEIELKQEDVRVDVYRSSGKGGQGVNTTDSAVRLTHLPTGIVVTCQNERSQIKNKEQAMKVLKTKIYDKALQEKEQSSEEDRRKKIGTGNRSEKIRTYNYPNNRVTDHRINFTIIELDRIMEGHLEPVIDALVTEDLKRKMEQ